VADKLIALCRLYENTSKTTGRKYFVGNLSFTSKLLVFQNEDAKDGEPGWTIFLSEREPKPQQSQAPRQPGAFDDLHVPDPGELARRRQPYPNEREF
jgi:hypothetical protein